MQVVDFEAHAHELLLHLLAQYQDNPRILRLFASLLKDISREDDVAKLLIREADIIDNGKEEEDDDWRLAKKKREEDEKDEEDGEKKEEKK